MKKVIWVAAQWDYCAYMLIMNFFIIRKLTFTLAAISMSLFGINLNATPLAIGADAPAIIVLDQNAASVDLGAKLATGTTLVYFYPKADTGGCTAQACSLRDGIEDLKALGVDVIGVSKDTPAAQKKFADKYNLPFTLIADDDGKVIKAFGVPTIVAGISARQSFLVRDGKIIWHSAKAGTKNHAEEVEAAIATLGS